MFWYHADLLENQQRKAAELEKVRNKYGAESVEYKNKLKNIQHTSAEFGRRRRNCGPAALLRVTDTSQHIAKRIVQIHLIPSLLPAGLNKTRDHSQAAQFA